MTTESTDLPQVVRALHGELIQFGRFMHQLKQSHVGGPIGPSGTPILARLVKDGAMRTSTLAESVALDASTVSRQADVLVKAGLVHRIADPQDGRATLLEATPEGREEFAAYRKRVIAVLDAVLQDWSLDQVEQFTVSLRRLNEDAATRLPGLLDRA